MYPNCFSIQIPKVLIMRNSLRTSITLKVHYVGPQLTFVDIKKKYNRKYDVIRRSAQNG